MDKEKITVGDTIRIVNYGCLCTTYHEDNTESTKDIEPELIGKEGIVDKVEKFGDAVHYAINGIPEKYAWWNEDQIELIKIKQQFDIKVLARDVRPKWYSFSQLKLRKLVLALKEATGKGDIKTEPITVGLEEPQFTRIYEQIQGIKGVYVHGSGTIVEFDDLFYKVYIRVSLIHRELIL